MDKGVIAQIIMNKTGLVGTEGLRRANQMIDPAIAILSRKPSIPWGKKATTFTLSSGTGSYTIGTDILTEHENMRGIVSLWHTDIQDSPIHIWSVDRWNTYGRGSTTTGRPVIACLHSDEKTLEVYPIPDADYTAWTMIRMAVESIDDVTDIFRDAIAWQAVMLLTKAGTSAYIEAEAALNQAIREAGSEGLTRWEGDQIDPQFSIGVTTTGRRDVDSGNKLGLG